MVPSELPFDDLLLQLSEEASELAQACAKFVRKRRDNNPTPVTEAECVTALIEELADVAVASEVVIDVMGISDSITPLKEFKLKRWRDRLSQ